MVSLKIDDAEVKSIWSEGYSGQAPRKINKDGDGIGLFIVRQLADLMGGEVMLFRNRKPNLREIRMGIEYHHNVFRLSVPSP